jgi:hypothetical protein
MSEYYPISSTTDVSSTEAKAIRAMEQAISRTHGHWDLYLKILGIEVPPGHHLTSEDERQALYGKSNTARCAAALAVLFEVFPYE